MRTRTALASAAFAAVLLAPTAAAAAPTTDPAESAAGYLVGQLVNGDHLESVFGDQSYPDTGLTIDAIFAFAASGVAGDSTAKAATWVGANLAGYIGDGVKESYVNGTAKSALLAEVLGEDPTNFHGTNLITRLSALLQPSGQFKDMSEYGDFTTTFSQSYSILALAGAPGGTVPASAVTFLIGAQCDDGGFRVSYAGACASDVDGTALAVQALAAAGNQDDVDEGIDWLLANQHADGGFGGGLGNANSTGLAAQALRLAGEDAAADKAVAYLKALQVGCSGELSARGGVAYNPVDPTDPASGFQTATAPRATTQAILGLTGVGFADLTTDSIAAAAPTLDCPVPAAPAPLANTGVSVTGIVLIAAGLLVAGAVLVVVTRSRRRIAA